MGDGAVEFLVVDARLQGVLAYAGPGPGTDKAGFGRWICHLWWVSFLFCFSCFFVVFFLFLFFFVVLVFLLFVFFVVRFFDVFAVFDVLVFSQLFD